MSERVAIVVGAGGELGRATAETLAAAGLTTVGVDPNEEALKELPDCIRREAADPADPAAARSVVGRIAAEAGPPEVLVNTIGVFHPGQALTAAPADLRLMIDVNLGAALWLTQAVAPYMRDRGSGSIVHVAARPGLEPAAGPARARDRPRGDRRHHRLPRERRRRAGQRRGRAAYGA
jgi:NAD(P)-dependent dehydrogenase (short-subunit alcohol dehydrogenase family)